MILQLEIKGQQQSGKNRILITRTGHRYPPKRFVEWRDAVIAQIRQQTKGRFYFQSPSKIGVMYVPGDKRRRDVPGMMDSLFHVLERAGVVADDALLENAEWATMSVDRENPRLTVHIQEKDAA